MKILATVFLSLLTLRAGTQSSTGEWRPATEAQLRKIVPARAPVEKERIETEFRTASAISDGKGHFVLGVLLITAGYSAEGKYSHYFVTQVPISVGNLRLPAGNYVLGWKRGEESLSVKFYEAETGKLIGSTDAMRMQGAGRVESFHIYPPDKSFIQIGRFTLRYQLEG